MRFFPGIVTGLNMRSSLFKKQFIIYLGVIVITFVILGIVLSRAFENYFTEQTMRSLTRQGERISRQYARAALSSGIEGRLNLNEFYNQLLEVNEDLDASYILVDTSFNIIDVSADIDPAYIGMYMSPGVFAPVLEGKVITARARLEGIYDEPTLTVAYPIIIGRYVMCAILMNSSLPELDKSVSEAYRIGLWCLLASAGIAFVLLFIASERMLKPLREMNEAARIIAGGDFDKRIRTKSNDEIGQLARSLNNMAESLSKQEAARRDFISNISHDFRSPLTSIRGFLQAIEDGTVPQEKQSRYIGIVLEETERLSALAENILALNSMSFMENKLNIEEFDINPLIKKTVLKLERRIREKDIKCTLKLSESESVVIADLEAIERVIYNLCDNAVKFTQNGGSICIETTRASDELVISVSDTGPGIPENEQSRVFERFYKADLSRGGDKKGSGLGLAIAREFVKAHGCSISLKSEPNKGSTFTFSLKSATVNEKYD